MNIWTAFFLVLSVVILASPLLSSPDAVRNGSASGRSYNGRQDPEDNELELDLASGRLAREDYEAMTGQKAGLISETVEGALEGDGNLS
ncbi:MAG: hypothetical protein RRA15_08670 [bacterium]|nr:hypothetical protein [bacterium]MDT8366554.1 hypothetical protein [bacterium]